MSVALPPILDDHVPGLITDRHINALLGVVGLAKVHLHIRCPAEPLGEQVGVGLATPGFDPRTPCYGIHLSRSPHLRTGFFLLAHEAAHFLLYNREAYAASVSCPAYLREYTASICAFSLMSALGIPHADIEAHEKHRIRRFCEIRDLTIRYASWDLDVCRWAGYAPMSEDAQEERIRRMTKDRMRDVEEIPF